MAEVIAATQRPDGTWRKERRVKAGYVPPDEVEKYANKMVKFHSEKPAHPPGYTPPTAATTTVTPMSKNQKKNERKKQKRKEKREEGDVSEVTEKINDVGISATDKSANVCSGGSNDDGVNNKDGGIVDVEKKMKGLVKKLKQIAQLKEREDRGEVLEPEQKDKVARQLEYEEELRLLNEG